MTRAPMFPHSYAAWHASCRWIQRALKLGHLVKPSCYHALARLARALLGGGGPVGSHPDVGICRGVPPTQSKLAKTPQASGIIDVSLTQALMLAAGGQVGEAPLNVSRVTG
jgi:hypothetical protein